jgi:diketogulonate reductase-like aldo/keto reductase
MIPRRTILKYLGAVPFTLVPFPGMQQKPSMIYRTIPATGEQIPVVGMGSWLTFDVGNRVEGRERMQQVLDTFVRHGGKMIDSSPMYGSSEEVIGALSEKLGVTDQLWYATKVWTDGKERGVRQIEDSSRYFHHRVQLFQIHNLRDFKVHYTTLMQMKESGKSKYIGITHYVNGMHGQLLRTLRDYPLDFVQANFNIDNPHAEETLLPGAADLGIAVIVNRPFQTGRLFDMIGNAPLPAWIREKGVDSWASCFLKYIISHPAVTCVIPATTQVPHVIQNLRAGHDDWIPDVKERVRLREDYLRLV